MKIYFTEKSDFYKNFILQKFGAIHYIHIVVIDIYNVCLPHCGCTCWRQFLWYNYRGHIRCCDVQFHLPISSRLQLRLYGGQFRILGLYQCHKLSLLLSGHYPASVCTYIHTSKLFMISYLRIKIFLKSYQTGNLHIKVHIQENDILNDSYVSKSTYITYVYIYMHIIHILNATYTYTHIVA